MSVATPLKNSVSNGIASLAFGAQGIYLVEFSERRSTFRVFMTGNGVELNVGVMSDFMSIDSFLSRGFAITYVSSRHATPCNTRVQHNQYVSNGMPE